MVTEPGRPAGPISGFTGADAPTDEDLYTCVHCGLCLNACPTYLETGLEAESPRGRIALMKAVREGRTAVTPSVLGHWELCIQCRACEAVCPSNVPYGRLMEATRTEMARQAKRSVKERAARAIGYRWLLPGPRRLRAVATGMKLYQKSGLRTAVRASRVLRLMPGGLYQLENSAPQVNGKFFRARGQVYPAQGTTRKSRIALLSGCVMPLLDGRTMEAAVRVLTRNGVEVVVPANQGCCGALNVHAGERDTARDMARRNVDAFLAADVDAIVVASAGCASTMKEYGGLLAKDAGYAEKAKRAGKLTRDIHEFLAALPVDQPKAELKLKVTYQDACHLAQAQRITAAPRQILRAIPGLELVEMQESTVCCGAGGTYFLSEPEMSARLGGRKAGNIAGTRATVVTTANPGCAIQMKNALRQLRSDVQVKYVVDLLDEAYSLESSHRDD
ncbi:MAG: 4Fe-4S dicluster domain-containing protein [Chloroflexi bacterium]|nr:4Fe-4S dicluster domain-containing protein [Chloroflexota bacterium]